MSEGLADLVLNQRAGYNNLTSCDVAIHIEPGAIRKTHGECRFLVDRFKFGLACSLYFLGCLGLSTSVLCPAQCTIRLPQQAMRHVVTGVHLCSALKVNHRVLGVLPLEQYFAQQDIGSG